MKLIDTDTKALNSRRPQVLMTKKNGDTYFVTKQEFAENYLEKYPNDLYQKAISPFHVQCNTIIHVLLEENHRLHFLLKHNKISLGHWE